MEMFADITDKFTKCVCENNLQEFGKLFATNGIYHDYIYGNFKGRNNIKRMLSDLFHRDTEQFYWKMFDHVFNNNIGYAKYRFSFISKIPEYTGKKVILSGMSSFKIKNKKILEYSESVNGGLAMVQLGISPLKMEKVFIKWFKRSLKDDPKLSLLKN